MGQEWSQGIGVGLMIRDYWVTVLCAMALPTEDGDVPVDCRAGYFVYSNGKMRFYAQIGIKPSVIVGLSVVFGLCVF